MMICSAPRRLAAITPHSPTAPSPTTATESPGLTPATTAAWWPVPSTSERVSSDGISASSSPTGSAYSVPSARGTRTASACAAPVARPSKKPPWTQAVCSPSWQKAQVPSEKANGITTRSPGLTVRTSGPTSSTRPIASWPIGRPLSVGSRSAYGHRSLPQTQALVTRMIASVGSTIEGSGTSSTRTSPAAYMSVARMVLAPGLEVVRLRRSTLGARATTGAGDRPGRRHGVDGRPAQGVEGGAVSPPLRS